MAFKGEHSQKFRFHSGKYKQFPGNIYLVRFGWFWFSWIKIILFWLYSLVWIRFSRLCMFISRMRQRRKQEKKKKKKLTNRMVYRVATQLKTVKCCYFYLLTCKQMYKICNLPLGWIFSMLNALIQWTILKVNFKSNHQDL